MLKLFSFIPEMPQNEKTKVMEFCKKTGSDCYGKKELKLLFEISTLLNKVKRDLKSNLFPVIELLSNYLTTEYAMFTMPTSNTCFQ